MRYIGLTGNVASGKSEASRLFAQHGATIIDADLLAREAVIPGTSAFERIIARWGSPIVGPDGMLDRAALRHIVFNDQTELDALNAIVHPGVAVLRDAALAEARARGDPIVIYAVPLLFEQGLTSDFDRIILVDAPRAVRLERLTHLRGMEPAEAMNMIASQMSAQLKRARADILIENDQSLDVLAQQVEAAWKQLTAPWARPSLAV